MGQCCGADEDKSNDVDMIRGGEHPILKNPNKLITLIKIQSNIRAYLSSKHVQSMRDSRYHNQFNQSHVETGNFENEVVSELS